MLILRFKHNNRGVLKNSGVSSLVFSSVIFSFGFVYFSGYLMFSGWMDGSGVRID